MFARHARLRAKRKRAKRRVAKIEAELEALGDTAAMRTGGASNPARPSNPKWILDTWIRLEG